MSHRWLLIVLLLWSGCPGTADPRLYGRRDGRVDPPSFPSEPPSPINTNVRADGGAAPRTSDSQPAQMPKPDTQPPAPAPPAPPPAPACTPLDAVCGNGAPACCDGSLCVNYTNVGVKCGKICTGAAECPEACCIATTGGTSVCAPATFCPAQPPPNPNPNPTPPPAGGLSCKGSCGGQAPGGCYCDFTCVIYGDCCPDYYLCLF